MFYEENPKEYHSAIVDVTDKCNLRCRHCFYYREEHDSEDLDDEGFLSGLEELKKYKDVKGYKYTEEQKNYLDLTWEERDDVIYRVLKLKKRYPGKIFNPDRTLELMLSENAGMCTSKCNMPRRTLTLDLKLNRKLPCVLGRDVDCSKCGCVFPYLQQAKKEGDPEALRIRF